MQCSLKTDPLKSFSLTVLEASDTDFTFQLKEDMPTGTYTVVLQRDGNLKNLGETTIRFKANLNIPNREGTNIKGVVYCDGKGLPNVVVSDGFEVTQTDANGHYYLYSEKKNGYVFISIPKNYEVDCNQNEPMFYQHINNDIKIVEQKNFALKRTDNNHFFLLTMADIHLFKVQASSATSTLEIKVTDRFGNIYTETMKRPKAFNCNMQ